MNIELFIFWRSFENRETRGKIVFVYEWPSVLRSLVVVNFGQIDRSQIAVSRLLIIWNLYKNRMKIALTMKFALILTFLCLLSFIMFVEDLFLPSVIKDWHNLADFVRLLYDLGCFSRSGMPECKARVCHVANHKDCYLAAEEEEIEQMDEEAKKVTTLFQIKISDFSHFTEKLGWIGSRHLHCFHSFRIFLSQNDYCE